MQTICCCKLNRHVRKTIKFPSNQAYTCTFQALLYCKFTKQRLCYRIPPKMYHVRFTRICNRGLFPHIFAAYFAITWSAYFEKNVRVFLTCLVRHSQHQSHKMTVTDISCRLVNIHKNSRSQTVPFFAYKSKKRSK